MEHARDQIQEAMSHNKLKYPLIFSNVIGEWPASKWSPDVLTSLLKGVDLKFRVGLMQTAGVQWETGCHQVTAGIQDFLEWLTPAETKYSGNNSLQKIDSKKCWLYSDYTHMRELFSEDILQTAVDWSVFGLGKTGSDSTFWLGSRGAYTPGHYDTYGYNLVAQIHGRKRWRLYSPQDSAHLYPTRIPYEESSVYSEVHIPDPDYTRHPAFRNARCYDVTLTPGDVLYVPRHWWHYVESLDTTVSVNCWVDTPLDDASRLEEALTRLLMCGILPDPKSEPMFDSKSNPTSDLSPGLSPRNETWLNPTEEFTTTDLNVKYVNSALHRLQANTHPGSESPSCYGDIRTRSHVDVAMGTVSMDTCPCKACDACRQLRELNSNSMAVKHIAPTNPIAPTEGDMTNNDSSHSNRDVAKRRRVAMDTESFTLNDVMTCVTKPDVIELVAKHLQEMRRTLSRTDHSIGNS